MPERIVSAFFPFDSLKFHRSIAFHSFSKSIQRRKQSLVFDVELGDALKHRRQDAKYREKKEEREKNERPSTSRVSSSAINPNGPFSRAARRVRRLRRIATRVLDPPIRRNGCNRGQAR